MSADSLKTALTEIAGMIENCPDVPTGPDGLPQMILAHARAAAKAHDEGEAQPSTDERERLKTQLDHLDFVEEMFDKAPHADAVKAIRKLKDLRAGLFEALPLPGYSIMCHCESCELPIGTEEAASAGDVWLCEACMGELVKAHKADPKKFGDDGAEQ